MKSNRGEWAPEVVHWGKIAWENAGRDPATFDRAVVKFDRVDGGTQGIKMSNLLKRLD